MGDERSFIDEIHQDIVEFAERHIDDDDRRYEFIDDFLEGKGYKKVSVWGPPEEPKKPARTPSSGGGRKSYFKK